MASNNPSIEYSIYNDESQLDPIMRLMEKDLSEPYSAFTYRYFVNNWPELTILATIPDQENKPKLIGCIVAKLEHHQKTTFYRGYIAMLAVDKDFRKLGIGSKLVTLCVQKMQEDHCSEVVLETEEHNMGALALYQNLGFIKDKRLARYYLNGSDAYRLKLFLPPPSSPSLNQ